MRLRLQPRCAHAQKAEDPVGRGKDHRAQNRNGGTNLIQIETGIKKRRFETELFDLRIQWPAERATANRANLADLEDLINAGGWSGFSCAGRGRF